MTITEGLQEVNTILKRIEKKQQFIQACLCRHNIVKDQHETDGGSRNLIKKERQAIRDLENNIIDIRSRIHAANTNTKITVCDETKSIAEWLIWKRELASNSKRFLNNLSTIIKDMRSKAAAKGYGMSDNEANAQSTDVIVNINEKELFEEIEKMETILSTLDGQLSLKNATVQI